jgi:membrane protein YqaA with SNARE-associated domain
MKKLDVKTYITLLIATALVFFVGLLMFRLEMDKEIGLMFFTAFTNITTAVTTYFFTRKAPDSVHKE